MTSPSQYLDSHHITFYMEDCITQLLLYREDNPKVNVRNFLADYFKCLNSGNHVLLRDFAFISATPHNRLSFVRLIYRAYCNLNEVGDCLSLQELHSLLLLLCPDLPWRLVDAAGRTAYETVLASSSSEGAAAPPAAQTTASSSPDSLKQARFLFSDFLMAFQIHLLYDEFLEKCAELYESLLTGRSNNIDVFLPQTDQQQQPEVPAAAGTAPALTELQRVSSTAFSRLIEGACYELQLHVPNMDIIRKSLGSNRTITYREFVGGLVRNKELSAALVTETELSHSAETHLFSANWPPVSPVASGAPADPLTSHLVVPTAAAAVAPPQPDLTSAASGQAPSAASSVQQRQKRLIAGAPKPGGQKLAQKQQQSRAGRHQQATGSSSESSEVSGSSGGGSSDTDSDSV